MLEKTAMPTLSLKGATIFYDVWGDTSSSRVVTLVNGFTRTSADFKGLARELGESGKKVVVLDNRGAGQSQATEPFTFKEAQDDIVAVWDCLQLKSSALAGISYGGALSMGVASRYPSRVSSLVLISTSPKSRSVYVEPEAKTPDLTRYFSQRFLSTHQVLFKALEKEMRVAFEDATKSQGAKLQRQAMRGFDLTSDLARITANTLIIHGTDDRIVPFIEADVIHAQIPESRIEAFEGAGHLLLAETPRRLYETVTRFF